MEPLQNVCMYVPMEVERSEKGVTEKLPAPTFRPGRYLSKKSKKASVCAQACLAASGW